MVCINTEELLMFIFGESVTPFTPKTCAEPHWLWWGSGIGRGTPPERGCCRDTLWFTLSLIYLNKNIVADLKWIKLMPWNQGQVWSLKGAAVCKWYSILPSRQRFSQAFSFLSKLNEKSHVLCNTSKRDSLQQRSRWSEPSRFVMLWNKWCVLGEQTGAEKQ